MNIVRETARTFRDRVRQLDLRGKQRDTALLDYWSGAIATCRELGAEDEAEYLQRVGMMILQVRGYSEIEKLCNLPDPAGVEA